MKTFFRRQVWEKFGVAGMTGTMTSRISRARGKCVATAWISWSREIEAIADEMGVIACENWNGSYHAADSWPAAAVVARRFSTARRKLRAFLDRIEGLETGPDASVQRLVARQLVRPGD